MVRPYALALVALAACGPIAAQQPRPAPPAASDWRDWLVTPGTWTYERDARGSVARFGRPGQGPLMVLRCDRAERRVVVSRAGSAPMGATMVIRTSSSAMTLAVQAGGAGAGNGGAMVSASVDPRSPLLDAMGYSRGRFVVETGTLPVLVVPAWPEILRVTEDCRTA